MWLLPSSNEDEADPPLPGAGPDGVATINQKLRRMFINQKRVDVHQSNKVADSNWMPI
jgi:hypothetical protein